MYPAPLRSYFMYLANTGLFRAKWSNDVHDEWIRNVLKNNTHISFEQLERTRQLMDKHVPDCLVEGYESIIDGLTLPDPDDRHVLAAAIKGQAESIITFNLKDFPERKLSLFDIQAVHPDEFLSDMFEMNPALCLKAAQQHRRSLKNPAMTVDEYLDCLQRQKLPRFVSKLRLLSSGL